jgi:hypothetical protein
LVDGQRRLLKAASGRPILLIQAGEDNIAPPALPGLAVTATHRRRGGSTNYVNERRRK